MAAAFFRTIFAQPNSAQARRQHREAANYLDRSRLMAVIMMADAEGNATTFAAFPRHH